MKEPLFHVNEYTSSISHVEEVNLWCSARLKMKTGNYQAKIIANQSSSYPTEHLWSHFYFKHVLTSQKKFDLKWSWPVDISSIIVHELWFLRYAWKKIVKIIKNGLDFLMG